METQHFDIHPYAEIFPQMPADEWDAFLADVHEHGVQEPVVLFEGKVLDGRHRQQAVLELNEKHGITLNFPVREFCGNRKAALRFVWSSNFFRRHLTPTQKGTIGAEISEHLLAEERRGAPEGNTNADKNNSPNIWGIESEAKDKHANESDAIAARQAGVSRETIRKSRKVKAKSPALFESMKAGDITLEKALTAVNMQIQEEKHEQLKAIPPPTGKYRCIVIDPPWPIAKIERDERPNQSAKLDYPTMTLEEIQALPVPDLLHEEGCHVYLWVTQKYLPAGLELFKAWGIKYQCLMTWVKPTGFTPYSWMYNTEHVLFGHVGNLKLDKLGLKLSFDAPVTRHSEKPEVFYDRVTQASLEPRLEMFSRQEREGFKEWGNEVAKGSSERL